MTSRWRPGRDRRARGRRHLGRARRPAPAHPHPRRGHGRRRGRPIRRPSSPAWVALAVLNLEGLQARYEDPDAVLADDRRPPRTTRSRRASRRPTSRPSPKTLVARRIAELHAAGSPAVVAATPAAARRWGPFCAEHGADAVPRPVAGLVGAAHRRRLRAARAARVHAPHGHPGGGRQHDLLRRRRTSSWSQGIAAIFVGVGPGAACTTREVLGIGVPQVTAIADVAAARDDHLERTGRYVPGRRRRWHAPRRGAGQGRGRWCGRAHAGLAAGARHRGAGPRHELGHGGAVADAAARHAHPGRHRRAARAHPLGPVARHRRQRRTSSGRCASRWPPSARTDIRAMQAGRDRLRAGHRRRGQVLAAQRCR